MQVKTIFSYTKCDIKAITEGWMIHGIQNVFDDLRYLRQNRTIFSCHISQISQSFDQQKDREIINISKRGQN